MNTKTGWRWLSLMIVITMLLALVPGFTSAQEPTAPPMKTEPVLTEHSGITLTEAAPKAAEPRKYSRTTDYLDKLHPDLQALAAVTGPALPAEYGGLVEAAANEPILVEIIASADLKPGMEESALVERLRPYFVDGQLYAQPAIARISGNLQMLFGRILPSNLPKIASNGSVQRVYPIKFERAEYDVSPADDPEPEVKPSPEDWAQLRASADKLREGSLSWSEAKAFGDGREAPPTEDWFEVLPEGPAKAQAAWDRGYTGEGILVAVDDDGVDFGHPDIMGTQRIYQGTWSQDPAADSPYNGWPYAMDPFTMRAYAYDILFGSSDIASAHEGVTYFDTSATPSLSPCGSGTYCFDYAPLIVYGTPGSTHTYVVDAGMTQSGVLHVGTHHDGSLRDYVWGERVAVLVGDPNIAGVYDTVWVDLDDDYDFRDEKPVTKADPTNPATFNNPVSYRDMNADGKADLNGGLLYFIADGVNFIPGSDWLWGGLIPPPGNGDLIAMHGPWDSGYSHGTQCASHVVAQGAIDGALPSFRDLPPGPGQPVAAVYGMAPDAKLLAMNNAWTFSSRSNNLDSYMFQAFGWDAIDQNGVHFNGTPGLPDSDTLAASSHSYGWSADFNDGWDYLGQFIAAVQKDYAPYLQFLFSTGNGGPGYGTVAPPSPALGIGVGASTEYGSTGWDTITDTVQINFNDVAAFSNSGPGARDGAGVDIVAGGAFAAGSEELNYFSASTWGVLDGNLSWETWGGTSRSAPVALGIYALMADAYLDAHGTLPTHQHGKAMLMSSATDINYDVFKQGAGAVNGDAVTQIASGEYGVYMDAGSATWEPGGYRGDEFPGFAHVVYPGDSWNQDFVVRNDGPAAVDVQISDTYMQLIGSEELELTVTADMVAQEYEDNFYKAFHYFIPLTAEVGFEGAAPDWYNVNIPVDTDLMVVRQIFPFGEFDYDGDYVWDNRFYLMVYNWTDENGDGNVWEDKDANGVVNYLNDPMPSDITAGPELLWDDPVTELDRWEYGRFGYNRPYGNTNELGVRDPLERMKDGLFIGLRHHPGSTFPGDTHLKYRVEFYKRSDVDWLSTDVNILNVPAGGTAGFQGTVNVPANMPTGDYAAAIEILDPGPLGGEPNNVVVPVVMNVAADFGDGLTLGGVEAYNHDLAAGTAYNNGAVRGYFDWLWREESGDWRFLYMDIANQPVETPIFPTESFDAGIPGTWAVVDNDGAGLVWQAGSVCVSTNVTGGSGEFAEANSDCFGTASFDTELRTPAIDLSTASTPILEFKSAYDNYAGADAARVWASGNGGVDWDLLLEWTGDEFGPQTIQLPLTAYAGSSNVVISFQYDSNGTSGWYWSWQVDDVRVFDGVFPYPPDAHVLVKDEWQGPAPATDIDTIVLGPASSPLGNAQFGRYVTNLSDPAFFGPYTLDTVAQSVDDRAGRSIWRFNTTSGGNEEWIMFPIQDGLHRIMQHNVLYEGDAFEKVFTKTVGLLLEDVHSFEIDTFHDSGTVGDVTLVSGIDMSGLVADAFMELVTEYKFVEEPVPFVSSNTIEWAFDFPVTDGVSIEAWSSSSDISDIDLYIFYCTASGCEERGSSATATADEHVQILNPEDGTWLVGINNWSGPDGHFDLDIEVREMGAGLSVTGIPPGPVPAGRPTKLTVNYDLPMEPDKSYHGMVLLGPPEAPQLKEIPVTINRLGYTAEIMKDVNFDMTFPGNELVYTIDLFNLGGEIGDFAFTDPIPDNTSYVDASMSCIQLPMFVESFEDAWLPAGWTEWQLGDAVVGWDRTTSGDYISLLPHSGSYMAWHDDEDCTTACDSWMVTPQISVPASGGQLRFYQAVGWGAYYIYHGVSVTTDANPDPSVATYTEVWSGNGTASWTGQTVDLNAYAGQDIYVAFNYVGDWSSEWYVDDVSFDVEVCPTVNYTPGLDQISYVGPLPMGVAFMPANAEGFEGADWPPPGWEIDNVTTGGVGGWFHVDAATYPDFVHSGDYAAWANYTEPDIRLYSPWLDVTAGDSDLTFWGNTDTDNPDATMTVYARYEDGTATEVWNMHDEAWGGGFAYRQATVDLSAFVGERIRLEWHYESTAGAGASSFGLDDVVLPGETAPIFEPSATVELTVLVDNPLAGGTSITNTATLTYKHDAPPETEVHEAEAYSYIGLGPSLDTSYKEGPDESTWGAQILYDIVVENAGDALSTLTITDPVPDGTEYAWHDDSPPYQNFFYDGAADEMQWSGYIMPGETYTFTYAVRILEDPVVVPTTITNTATVDWEGTPLELSVYTDIRGYTYLPLVIKE